MPQAKSSRPAPRRQEVAPEKLREAAAHEEEIRSRAEELRGDATELDAALFLKLYPLLREPIHEGYLETISAGEGKPYESTGIRSVQVQHDRMNNVLTPLWWHEKVEYHQDGRLCLVTVQIMGDAVRDDNGNATFIRTIVERSSWGGVERGSTTGNLYKGSYTNAAKMAFARIGPGHEVYIGALDFDPDVSADAAKAQATPEPLPGVETITGTELADLKDKLSVVMPEGSDDQAEFWKRFKLKLGSLGVAGVGSWNEGLSKLTPAMVPEVEMWLAGGDQNGG